MKDRNKMHPQPGPTVDPVKLPRVFHSVEQLLRGLSRRGLRLLEVSKDSLLEGAMRGTGLTDFGDDSWRSGFGALMESYKQEARLNLFGRFIVERSTGWVLRNRLGIQEALNQNPEILEIPIHRPLFIVGCPRTGTTLLHNLLAQDPSARVPKLGELLWPAAGWKLRDRRKDWRTRSAGIYVSIIGALFPRILTVHPVDPEGPEECTFLFQNQFASLLFPLFANIPSYTEWLFSRDLVPDYRYYRLQLQLLQWCRSGQPWILKTPFHLLGLDALLKTFPDANIVWTHRDPQKVVPSMCSLVTTLRRIGSDHVDAGKIGACVLSSLETALTRAMKVRDGVEPGRLLDVAYSDLVADPVGVVKRIYGHFAYPLPAEVERNMKQWLDAHPRNQHGRHRYSAADFALDPEEIDRRLAPYAGRFNVRPE